MEGLILKTSGCSDPISIMLGVFLQCCSFCEEKERREGRKERKEGGREGGEKGEREKENIFSFIQQGI